MARPGLPTVAASDATSTDAEDTRGTKGTSRFAARALGSRLSLTLVGVSDELAARLWRSTTAEFEQVDLALSGYRSDSGLAVLNWRAGNDQWTSVDRRLYAAVSLAHQAWRRTDGRFDPRVLTTLARLGQPGLAIAKHPARTSAGQPVEWLVRDPRRRSIGLSEPIDLHGIGKGLALRWAWSGIVRSLPPGRGAMLDAGGDLVARSPAEDGQDWLIGIEHPLAAEDPIAVVSVADGAVCTSSTRLSNWTSPSGAVVHHLIDPATLRPGGDGLVSVTVAGADPAWAEVWTKDLFLRGSAGIAERARGLGLAAWWVDDAGELSMTPLARLVTRWP